MNRDEPLGRFRFVLCYVPTRIVPHGMYLRTRMKSFVGCDHSVENVHV